MRIYKEENLTNFEFWSGAKDRAEKLTSHELNQIETTLEELYPDGMSETELNDFFWFDFETVLGWIGKKECEECGEIFESGEKCECQEEEQE